MSLADPRPAELDRLAELQRAAERDDSAARLSPCAKLLDRVHAHLCRFIAYPSSHAAIAHVLWIAHAHAMGA